MKEQFVRTSYVLGKEAINTLKNMRVAIFGLGGVGGYVAESLARTGIEHFALIDHDTISISNINRQIIATKDTIGRRKVDVMKERMLSINEDIKVDIYPMFFDENNCYFIDLGSFDYIVDAIDSVKSKVLLIKIAKEKEVPIISSMGTGNKIDPTKLLVADIYKTEICPLAKVMRHELKKIGIKKLKVVYSKEIPIISDDKEDKKIIGSTAFVPSSAGLLIASEVIKDLLKRLV
jgi:tRNA A37 threonylcarbamoyladenosine dehydratase